MVGGVNIEQLYSQYIFVYLCVSLFIFIYLYLCLFIFVYMVSIHLCICKKGEYTISAGVEPAIFCLGGRRVSITLRDPSSLSSVYVQKGRN